MNQFAHGGPQAEDPALVPVRNAATVMIVDDRPEFEVLMVQRTSRAVFGASAWVFPGGRVDPEDALVAADVVAGRSDAECSDLLDVPDSGMAWWVAALRETVEEAGLLLGCGPASHDAIEDVRTDVHADPASFTEALRRHGLRLDLGELHEVGRFITPPGPPRRYDTRFFAAKAPSGQVARHDEEEIVRHRWISPSDALDAFRAGEFPMMSVTHRMVSCLDRYTSAADVIAAGARRLPPQRVRVVDPDGDYVVVLPGEPGYETAELEVETGWIRI